MAGENIHGKDCRDIYSKKLIILDYLDQKQISKFYNICDFFVFPSLYETYGKHSSCIGRLLFRNLFRDKDWWR